MATKAVLTIDLQNGKQTVVFYCVDVISNNLIIHCVQNEPTK